MAIVKFLTGTETNLLKKNSNGSYVNPITEGNLYVTAEKVSGVWVSNLYYDTATARIKVADTSGKAMFDHMNQNIAQTYIKTITMEGTKYASTDGATLTYTKGDGSEVTILLPLASDTKAGTVNTGAQTFAGNKTFLGQVILKGESDTAAGTANSGALIIGSPTGAHISFDANEIQAKASGTKTAQLHINNDGGAIQFGGTIQPNKDNTLSLGTDKLRWKNIYGVTISASNFSGALTGNVTGNLNGNAATADKWFRARTITLGSDMQGSVSIDGSKDVTLNANHYNVSCGSGNKSNYPWHRIATTGTVTGDYNDKDMTIVIRHSYHGGGYGVAKISLRTNSSGSASTASISWMYRYNISADSLQIGLRKTNKDTLADLYYKVGTWARATIYQVEGNRSWTLISSNEANDTTTSDKKSSKEVYLSVADGGTQLNAGYTDTIKGKDSATVQNANYATTSDGAITDSAHHNILTHYLSNIKFDGTTYKTEKVVAEIYDGKGDIKATVNFPTATANQAGAITTGTQTIAGDKTFTGMIKFPNKTTGITKGIQWSMGDNDLARILAGATASDAGYLEIATADGANEPIYIRQYSGSFATLKRTLTLLDGAGNTLIPGTLLPVTNASNDSTGQNIGSSTSLWKAIYARIFYAYSKFATSSGLFYANNDGDMYVANNTGLGGVPDDKYTLKVTGDTYHTGKIYADGALYIGHANAANALLYLNNKLALKGVDTWLRINDTKAFTSGTYFGSTLVRTDGQYQVGDGGKFFYANSSGNAYVSNSLGIGGTNTSYKLYVKGDTLHNGTVYFANGTTYWINNVGNAKFNKINIGNTGTFNTEYYLKVYGNGYFEDELRVNNYIYGDLGNNKITITVGGDVNTYYPVVITSNPTSKYAGTLLSITRNYNETAPSTWHNSTHKGGLTLTLLWNGSRYWDGNGAGGNRADVINLLQLEQTYCTMVAKFDTCTTGLVVWLRGGGATYHIFSQKGEKMTASVKTSTYTDGANRTFSPTTSVDSDNIDSYKHYLRRGGDYMRGTLKTKDILPRDNNTYNIGSADLRYKGIYAETFYAYNKFQNSAGSFYADKDGKMYVANAVGLGVGATPDTTYILKVYGNSIFNGILYFANGADNKKYWINNSGQAQFKNLTITNTATIQDGLRIGDNDNGDTSYIAFYGTPGDRGTNGYDHTFIGENRYDSSKESSELLLFKGNDIASNTSMTTAVSPGPDRIRHLAAGHLFQVMTAAISGAWTTVKSSDKVKNIYEIFTNGTRTHGIAYFSSGSTYFINNSGHTHMSSIALNGDSGDGYAAKGYRLYVGGTTYFKGDVTHNANIYLPKNGQIFAIGSKATHSLIRVVDNTSDVNGNGISIGGGGLVVIGAGESASAMVSSAGKIGGDENLYLTADGKINIEAGGDTIANRRGIQIGTNGNIIPIVAEVAQSVAFNIGTTSNAFVGMYSRWIHANAKSQADDGGLTLYGGSSTYSIYMRTTATQGTHGYTTGDWATYFNMNDSTTRGWIFKAGGRFVASISGAGYIVANRLSLQRANSSEYGRIYWYNTNYKTWITYMSNNANASCPTGGTPSVTTEVSTWALRSLIENNAGYGWIWEACANTSTGTPTARMSLSSNTGRLRIEGNASSNANITGQLIVSSEKNGSSGNTAIELWRGGNASWQIANESGTFYIRSNYTTSRQSTYSVNSLILDYNTGAASLPYLALGQTSRNTSYRLYVNGKTYLTNTIYFNSTSYYIDASANGKLNNLGIGDTHQGFKLNVKGTSRFTGIAYFTDTTDSTSVTTGAVQISGGLAIAKSIYSNGKYTSGWNNTYTLSDANTLTVGNATINRINCYVAHNSVQPIIAWSNGVNSYGYITRYSISSVRPSSDAWGRMRLAVGNNDDGTRIGAYLDIDGDNYISAHSKFGVNGRSTSYNFYVNGTSYLNGHVYIPNGASIIQLQSATSNYTTLAVWYKGGKSQAAYNPQIGQHNTGGSDGLGSISILSYATSTSPWSGTVGLFIQKNLMKLDGNRVPTTGNATGTVGSGIIPIYSNAGVLKPSTSTVGSSTRPIYMNNGTITAITAVGTAYGGTGVQSHTANRLVWSTSTTTIQAGYHYASTDRIAVNYSSKPDYNFYVSGSARITNRLYMTNWIQFTDATGLYSPSSKAGTHFHPNTISSYGSYAVQGAKGGYTGFLLGPNKNYFHIMSNGTNEGLYNESKGRWILHYNRSQNLISIGDSGYNGGYLLRIAGKTYSTGAFLAPSTASSWIDGQRYERGGYNLQNATDSGSYWPWMRQTNTSSRKWFSFGILGTSFYWIGSSTSRTSNGYDWGMTFNVANGYLQGCSRVYNAVWNDYAEFRKANTIEPGRVVIESKFGVMLKSTARLQAGGSVISDTYGTAMGETDECKTPIAVAGRVLAYPYEDRESYEAGDAVCTGPNGTVSKMTREEIKEYPERIIGIVSEIPTYETWGQENTKVNGRIWIKIK